MLHLHIHQDSVLTYIVRAAWIIAAIEIAVNLAPTKVTVGLVGAALALTLCDASRYILKRLAVMLDEHATRVEVATQRHAAVVEVSGLQNREVIKQAAAAHVDAIGNKVMNVERAAVNTGLAVVQGYLDASQDGRGGTQPFRVVR